MMEYSNDEKLQVIKMYANVLINNANIYDVMHQKADTIKRIKRMLEVAESLTENKDGILT